MLIKSTHFYKSFDLLSEILAVIIYLLTFFLYNKFKCSVWACNNWFDIQRSLNISMQWYLFDVRIYKWCVYSWTNNTTKIQTNENFRNKKNNCDLYIVSTKMNLGILKCYSKWESLLTRTRRYENYIGFCIELDSYLWWYLNLEYKKKVRRWYNKANIACPFLLNIRFIHSRWDNIQLGCASLNITHLEWINLDIQRMTLQYLLINW